MKKLIPMLAVVALICVACASQSRVLYNTLSTLQIGTTGAYNTYLSLVVQGQVPTNGVPAISADYNLFQVVWAGAVTVASGNTNSTAPQTVLDASAKVLAEIAVAKGVK